MHNNIYHIATCTKIEDLRHTLHCKLRMSVIIIFGMDLLAELSPPPTSQMSLAHMFKNSFVSVYNSLLNKDSI